MTPIDYVLCCIAEEACDVAHIALKSVRFCLSTTEPGQSLTNLKRLTAELDDLLGAVHVLGRDYPSLNNRGTESQMAQIAKINKIDKYLKEAQRNGWVFDPEERRDL